MSYGPLKLELLLPGRTIDAVRLLLFQSRYFDVYLLECGLLVLVLDPLEALSLLPSADARLPLCIRKPSDPVLEPVAPVALVFFTVRPRIYAESLLLVIGIISGVCSTIRPFVESFSIELAIFIHSNILTLVSSREFSVAAHLVIFPLAFVYRGVGPNVFSLTVLFALDKVALVYRVIAKLFSSMAMLHIILPLSAVLLHLFMIYVFSRTMSLIVDEFAFI